jgi:1-acyl-sn-glycerol-3-phosphate acyltransferase
MLNDQWGFRRCASTWVIGHWALGIAHRALGIQEALPVTTASSTPAAPKATYVYRGEGTSRFQAFAWNSGRLISRILSVLCFKLHVSGQNNIPKTGGVLMVSNHQSFLDPWLVGIAPSRQIHYMARDTLFNKKGGVQGFLHYLLELWNAFPVKRGSGDLGAIRMAVERLEKGFILNIFPEGTRSEDGTVGPMAPGMVLILNRVKTDPPPILPVIIDGAFEAWPRNAKFPRVFGGSAIRIHHGKPIPPSEWKALSPDELAARVRRELVKLQREIGSPHGEASEARVAKEEAEAAAAAAAGAGEKPRRRR